jgi:hypothetical protein
MGPGKDDQHEDPQQTLRPRQQGQARRIVASEPSDDQEVGNPQGRRLRLGTPTRLAPTRANPAQRDISASVQRGFTLGGPEPAVETVTASASKPRVQPWILFVAAGAAVLLLMALILRPSSGDNAEATANDRLVRQYTQYLETKGQQNNVDVKERKKEVIERLQAVTWAKAIGDGAALEVELRGLLFMDQDKNSPLYQYSVSQLKQLPTKKASGL